MGLTSQQTLSRHAASAASLTPVCLNISILPCRLRSLFIVVAWQRAGRQARVHTRAAERSAGRPWILARDKVFHHATEPAQQQNEEAQNAPDPVLTEPHGALGHRLPGFLFSILHLTPLVLAPGWDEAHHLKTRCGSEPSTSATFGAWTVCCPSPIPTPGPGFDPGPGFRCISSSSLSEIIWTHPEVP